MVRIIEGRKTYFTEKIIWGFGGKVVLLKETAPDIVFVGCFEGYFFLKTRKEKRSRFKES